jgi:hypothetical protein
MELLNALLDLVDAISAGFAVAMFWYTWVVVPPGRGALPPPKPSEPAELEQFVRTAALIRSSGHRLT